MSPFYYSLQKKIPGPKAWDFYIREAPLGFEPGIEVLQTFALPLGYGAIKRRRRDLNPRAGFPTYTLSRGTSSAS